MKGSYVGILLLLVWARVIGTVDGEALRAAVEWRDKPISREDVSLAGVRTLCPQAKIAQKRAEETRATFIRTAVRRGQRVLLEIEDGSKDKQGRLKAHVWHRGTLLAARALHDGIVCNKASSPHRYQELFRSIESDARDEGRGMWAQ